MGFNTAQDMTKMPFSQGNDVIQGFSGFPDKALRVSIAHGGMNRGFDDLDAVGFDDEIKPLEIRVPVMNDIAAGRLVIGKFHGQVSGLLPHPGGVRVWGTAGNMDAAGAEVDKKQYVKGDQSGFCPDLLGKKIGGPGHVQVGLDEGFPGQAFSLG